MPMSLPGSLVDEARREREDSALSSITSEIDGLIRGGMGGLETLAKGAADTVAPFAQMLSGGGIEIPTLDDLTPDVLKQQYAPKPPPQQPIMGGGMTQAAPSAIPGPDQSPGGTPVRSEREMAAPSVDDVAPDAPVTRETVAQSAAAALRKAGLPTAMAPYLAGIAINEGILQPGTIARDHWSVGGVKAPGSAGVVTVPTREVIDGQSVMQTASFGAFGSMQEGMDALAAFVRDSPRFGPVVKRAAETGDYGSLIAGFKDQGYATDPNWVRQVNSIASGLPVPPSRPTGPQPTTPPQAEQTPAAQGQAPTSLQGITPDQFGLGDADAEAICGPVLLMAFARANGRNPTIAEAKQIAAQSGGWTSAQGMGGPEATARALRDMGVPATYKPGALDVETIRRETQNGNPVGINTAGHYFVVEGVDSEGRLNLGASARALRASGGRTWFKPEEIAGLGMGAPTGAIYKDAPSSPTPSVAVAEMPKLSLNTAGSGSVMQAEGEPLGPKPRPQRNIEPLGPALAGATWEPRYTDEEGATMGTNRNMPRLGDPIHEGPDVPPPPPPWRNQAVPGGYIYDGPRYWDETGSYEVPMSQKLSLNTAPGAPSPVAQTGGGSPSPAAAGTTPYPPSPWEQATGGGPVMMKQDAGSVPVRDSWATDPQQAPPDATGQNPTKPDILPGDGGYAPDKNEQNLTQPDTRQYDEGPHEAIPGSVGAQPLPQTPNYPMSYGPVEQAPAPLGPEQPEPTIDPLDPSTFGPDMLPPSSAGTRFSPPAATGEQPPEQGILARGIDALGRYLPDAPIVDTRPGDRETFMGAQPGTPGQLWAWRGRLAEGTADALARGLGADPDTTVVNVEVGGVPVQMTVSELLENVTDPLLGAGFGVGDMALDAAGKAVMRLIAPYAKGAVRETIGRLINAEPVQRAGRAAGGIVREGADALGRGLQGVGREIAGGLMDLNPAMTPRMADGGPGIGRALAEGAGGALATPGGGPGAGRRIERKPGTTFAFGARPGERLEFNVKVVPLDSLVTSHADNLAVNRAFPSELQPRVRERAASRVQIDRIVKDFDPDQLLVDTHTIDRGPMIVGPDMVVESGNGRSIALRRLAKEDPEKYAEYVDALRAELPRYGLSEDALAGIDRPVLVRERVSDVDRARFAAEANVGVQAEMSPIERAVQDAGRLSDDAVTGLAVAEGQSVDAALLSAENAGLRRAYLASIPETERAALLDAAGNLNAAGLERLKSALLVRTYPGSAGLRLATAFVESTDPGIRNVEQGIYGSLPAVSRAEALIASGQRDAGLSIAQDVATAADAYSRLRRAGTNVNDYLAQGTLIGERETTPLQDRILAYLNNNARSGRRIRAMLDEYAQAVENQASPDQVDMFGGEVARASKEELFDGVLRGLGADAGAADHPFVGGTRAGGQVVEGAGGRLGALPQPGAGAKTGGGAGGDAAAAAGPQLAPDEQLARFNRARGAQPAGPAPLRDANLPPVGQVLPSGGPSEALRVQGAPVPLPRPGPIPQGVAPTGGPEGMLRAPGAPEPLARPTPMNGDILPPTGGEVGTLAREGAPPPLDARPLAEVAGEFQAPPRLPQAVVDAQEKARAQAERAAARGQEPLSPLQWTRALAANIGYSSMIGPATATVNIFGNLLEPVWAIPKETARAVSRGNVREATTMAAGAFRGMAETGTAMVDAIMARGRYASNPDHPTLSARTTQPILKAIATATEVGGRVFSGMPDAIFGTVARSAGEARQAAQIATDEGLKGASWSQRVKTLLGEVEQSRKGELPIFPTEVDDIIKAGEKYADDQTFRTRLGTVGRGASSLAGRDIPVVGNLLTPFFNTPWNMGVTLAERTPIGAVMNRQKGFDKAYDALVGSALVTGLVVGPAASGNITGSGPNDPEKRKMLEAEGWKPYHTLIDGVYVPNRVFGIYGKLLNAVGEAHDAMAYQRKDGNVGSEALRRFGLLLKEEPYLQGLSDIMQAINAPNGSGLSSYGASTLTRMVPYASTARAIGTAMDPTERVVDSGKTVPWQENVSQRVQQGVGLRVGLPVAQDVLGRPKENPQQGLRAILPALRNAKSEPLVRAYLDAGVDISAPPTSVEGVTLTPAQQRRYQEVMGRELGRVAGPTVSSPTWQNTPPATQKMLLETFQDIAKTLAEVAVQSEGGADYWRQYTEATLQKATAP